MGRLEHAIMSARTLPLNTAPALTRLESLFVVSAVALLSGLALADRVAAWMIGEFPTSPALWELRFEYLRPIAVFYDVASMRLGGLSGLEFTALQLAVSLVVIGGVLSPVRLLRAACLHALLMSSLALSAYSLDSNILGPAIGSPSSSYALLGAVVALPVLGLCLRIHADYLGLDQARLARQISEAALCMHDLAERFAATTGSFAPAVRRVAVVSARRDLANARRFER